MRGEREPPPPAATTPLVLSFVVVEPTYGVLSY
jgi:hypothetical protein